MLLNNINQNLLQNDNDFEIEEECEHMKTVYANPKLALLSDRGSRKKVNQDNGMVGERRDGTSILVVTDGVSSCSNSQAASKVAADTVYNFLYNSNKFSLDLIKSAILQANNKLLSLNDIYRNQDNSQTTIVTALVKDNVAIVGWVGDSRAYMIGSVNSYLLTEDDSWINMAKKKGYINKEEAINHPKRHIITQSLGSRESRLLNVHTSIFDIGSNSGILLCTDGLWDYVDKIDSLNHNQPIQLTLMKYITKANKNGGRDNITVALWLP